MYTEHQDARYRSPKRVDPPPVAGRVPPHDLDAEAAVLSAVLLDRNALDRVTGMLKPEHFYSEANARIFQAAQQLAVSMTPIDIVSVASWLRDREWLQKMGGPAYLAQLADATPAIGHVAAHAKVVHEKWRLRVLIATCQRVSAEGYGDVGEVQEFIESAEVEVRNIAAAQPKTMSGALTTDLADTVMARVEESLSGRVFGTSWGYAPIDARTGLLLPKGYNVLAARSGHGKTQLGTQCAVSIAEEAPRDGFISVVYMGSFEMPAATLLMRTICAEAEVSFKRACAGMISRERRFEFDGGECPACGASYRAETYETLPNVRNGKACNNRDEHGSECGALLVPAPSEYERLSAATRRLRQTPIIWDDRRCTPAELAIRVRDVQERAEAGKLATRAGGVFPKGIVRAVVVDYIQRLPAPPGPKNRSRQQEVAAISNGLVEDVAKGCDVAVIALAQINRAVDKQKDARPTLADIREAGDIEQDADEIIYLHREQYRLRDKTPVEWQNIAEVGHLKGRGGLDADLPPGRMWFVAGKFHSLPADERHCVRHAEMFAEAQDRLAAWRVEQRIARCHDCYRASWSTWEERVGVHQ